MILKFFLYLFTLGLMAGCMGGGTHGSIKSYDYPVSKYVLQTAISKIILSNANIKRDTSKDYYNDGENYITIKIIGEDIINEYTFRFYGDKKDWDSSKTSEIFIAYAFDKEGNGGSDGNGGVKWYKPFLKKKLTGLFEDEFIKKLDKELRVIHSE